MHPTREKCFLRVWTMPLHSPLELFPTSPSPLHLKLKTITTERCTAPMIFFQTYTRSPAPTAPFSTFLFLFQKKSSITVGVFLLSTPGCAEQRKFGAAVKGAVSRFSVIFFAFVRPSWVEQTSFSSSNCRFPRPCRVAAIIFPHTKWLPKIIDYRDSAALRASTNTVI